MKVPRRFFDAEFKKMAIELHEKNGKSYAQIGRELGIKPDLVRRWKLDMETYGEGSFPGNGKPLMTEEQKKIYELEKALKDAKLECEILKKAVRIFSKEDGKGNIGL